MPACILETRVHAVVARSKWQDAVQKIGRGGTKGVLLSGPRKGDRLFKLLLIKRISYGIRIWHAVCVKVNARMVKSPWGHREKEDTMKFIRKWGLALVPGLALATPALALAPPDQADLSQPGSVIIFPKFINMSQVHVDATAAAAGILVPRTEIEIGVVCPVGATCVEHESVKLRFHWVCPAVENANSNICLESDFDLTLSIDGKLAFPADGTVIFTTNQPRVTEPH